MASDNHCRLCAELMPMNKQVDLATDDDRRIQIAAKLCKINAAIDFSEQLLPKTVCYECINALNNAVDFLDAIENAQTKLLQTFAFVVKKEKVDDDEKQKSGSVTDPVQMNMHFKLESDQDYDIDTRDNYSDSEQSTEEVKQPVIKKKNIALSKPMGCKDSWSQYSWLCNFCETQFPTIHELKAHSMSIHKICNPYRCLDCKIRKLRLDRFLLHVQKHRKQLRFSCYKCFKIFKTRSEARKHTQTHLRTKFICGGCNSQFPCNEELKKHQDDYFLLARAKPNPVLLIPPQGLTCIVCQKTFTSRGGLKNHALTHTERTKDHVCELCGKAFFAKRDLNLHLVMHTDAKPFKCEICNATFKVERLLKNHVEVHNNVKPFSCSQCGRCFRLRKQLDSHSIIHTDILPYSCSYCDKKFRFKTILNNHVRLHTGEKPYSCEVCKREFSNWSNYNKHMKRKHGMDTSKKKHTPDGVYPIDPNTGEVIKPNDTKQMDEWRLKMMKRTRSGRPPKTAEDVQYQSEGS